MKEYKRFIPDWIKIHPYFDSEWNEFNKMVLENNISNGGNREDFYILLSLALCIPKNGTYIEVGSGTGSFIISVAKLRPDVKCYGIDISVSTKQIELAEKYNIKNIEFFIGEGAETVCKKWDKETDLLFVDGYHYFPNLFWDYIGWYPFIKTGGRIAFHDM